MLWRDQLWFSPRLFWSFYEKFGGRSKSPRAFLRNYDSPASLSLHSTHHVFSKMILMKFCSSLIQNDAVIFESKKLPYDFWSAPRSKNIIIVRKTEHWPEHILLWFSQNRSEILQNQRCKTDRHEKHFNYDLTRTKTDNTHYWNRGSSRTNFLIDKISFLIALEC